MKPFKKSKIKMELDKAKKTEDITKLDKDIQFDLNNYQSGDISYRIAIRAVIAAEISSEEARNTPFLSTNKCGG